MSKLFKSLTGCLLIGITVQCIGAHSPEEKEVMKDSQEQITQKPGISKDQGPQTASAVLEGQKPTDCQLPNSLKAPGKTFVINKKLSCPTNIFLYALPSIYEEAVHQVSSEKKEKDPQAVGRKAYELLGDHFAKKKPDVESSDFMVDGRDGHHKIPVRLYKGTDSQKVILFTHGGGWTRGNLETHDTLCRHLCKTIGNDPQKADTPLVSPIMASDETLKKFPPVILINAQCDPLTDEGKAFAKRLTDLGISVKHKVIQNTIHIFAQYFDLFPEAQEAQDFIKENWEQLTP